MRRGEVAAISAVVAVAGAIEGARRGKGREGEVRRASTAAGFV
jgi:hypothetical protein